jgi:hypothetical protein
MPILPDSFVRSFLKYQKCSPLKINWWIGLSRLP